MRRVEGIEPGERRDGREHGDLRRARRAERRWHKGARHGLRRDGPATRRAARRPGAKQRVPAVGRSVGRPLAAPTHLLRWRQRADRCSALEAARAAGSVTLSFADARGGARTPKSCGAIGGGALSAGTAAHAQHRPSPFPPLRLRTASRASALREGGQRLSNRGPPGRRPGASAGIAPAAGTGTAACVPRLPLPFRLCAAAATGLRTAVCLEGDVSSWAPAPLQSP